MPEFMKRQHAENKNTLVQNALILLVTATLLLLLLSLSCDVQMETIRVEFAEVTRLTLFETVDALGKVEPNRATEVLSPLTAQIGKINVAEGDDVYIDQELIEFKDNEYNQSSFGSLAQSAGTPVVLKSPLSGKVVKISVLTNQVVTPGNRLMTIVDMTPLYVIANVNETDISKVKANQKVDVTLDAYPDKVLEGKVISIDLIATINQSGATTFPVKIEIEQAKDVDIRLGMTAQVNIIFGHHDSLLVVPVGALKLSGGQYTVFTVRDGIATERKVEIGTCTDQYCEIKDGLEEGELIISRGVHGIKSGQRVQ